MISRLFFLLTIVLGSVRVDAHSLQNIRAVVDGDNVVVYYDLLSEVAELEFAISLYSSWNNYTSPLTFISGDAGELTKQGRNKAVVWEEKNEMGFYQGEIDFEVRAVFGYNPLRFVDLSDKLKAGKTYPISWQGGQTGDTISIDVLRDGQREEQLVKVPNSGQCLWRVPNECGSKLVYSFQLQGSRTAKPQKSQGFVIGKGLPLMVKILPVVWVRGNGS